MARLNDQPPIIIKKVKKGGHPHHGGAWKIAYADFVTAMMAFFLLMWLISMTTPEQKAGLADFFAPASISKSNSGAGGTMGGTAFDPDGARMAGSTPKADVVSSNPASPKSPDSEDIKAAAESAEGKQSVLGDGAAALVNNQNAEQEITSRDANNFKSAAESLRQAMADMPELAELSRHIMLDETPEGLRIQIIDQDGRSMFPPTHAEPYERTRILFEQVGKILLRLPNRIIISGHTDANYFEGENGYTNWELTADRANATRRIFEKAGVPDDRIYQVSGKAATEPLLPEDPYQAGNRRITIILLREAPVTPPGFRP